MCELADSPMTLTSRGIRLTGFRSVDYVIISIQGVEKVRQRFI